ncbi:ACT domain-containing protein [Mesosutterella sp. AGMB02718]|uniref:ACT domain-containing protein n=1 Tax=Mesosutterella faecium TaxID=2925194 RepID=A0ABT7IPE8_9BURK|nr:ACT domain-containing protein [Mesosutterella sp. AGMB02718]MDL2060266.1 ACT domain-containing protein [Mesosutterella sp. AGMB02718]
MEESAPGAGLELLASPYLFAVAKIADPSEIDWSVPGTFVSSTRGELSVVCQEKALPASARPVSYGWKMIRVAGKMPFDAVGVMSLLSGALAREGIPLLAFSSYDTDFLFVKTSSYSRALEALEKAGCRVRR